MQTLEQTVDHTVQNARRMVTRIPPYITLALALILSGLATVYSFHARRSEQLQQFERLENRLSVLLQSRIQIYLNGLNGTRGLFFVHGVPTRAEFHSFVSGVGMADRFPGLRVVGWAQHDPHSHKTPVVYIEPSIGANQKAVQFDLSSERRRFSALTLARDSGEPVISDVVPMLVEGGPHARGSEGFMFLLPVYRGGNIPALLAQRRENILGYVFAACKVSDFFESIRRDLNEQGELVAFQVFDGPDKPNSAIYTSKTEYDFERASLLSHIHVHLGHHDWTIRIASLPQLSAVPYSRSPLLVLMVGLLMSVLLYSLARAMRLHHERIAASEERLKIVTNTLPALISYLDINGKYLMVNRLYADLYGLEVPQIVGSSMKELMDRQVFSVVQAHFERAIQGEALTFEHQMRFSRLGWRTMRVSLLPDMDPQARVRGVVMLSLDVTEIRRAELSLRENEAIARKSAEERLFLAEASQVLSSSLELDVILRTVTALAVPNLADWCAIHLDGADGRIDLAAVAHRDPERSAWARDFYHRFPAKRSDHRGVAQVFRTGEAVCIPSIDEEAWGALVEEDEHIKCLIATECRSYLCVPLQVRGHTFGTLSFVAAQKGRYTKRDLDLVSDLGRRVAVAIDNARLYLESQNVNRMKDEFLATLSHELRTPLNVIQGHAEILRTEENLPKDLRDSAEAIYRNAQIQTQIINDLLDVSAIIRGKVSFHPAPVSLNEVVSSTFESLRFAAEAKGMQMHLNLPSESVRVSGDPLRLQQIFWNLLSNAVKFTPRGGHAWVSLRVDQSNAQVIVKDTGRGIEGHFLPYIFDRFRQEESGLTRRYGGLGLGLSIVRQLVELHGGEVTASSGGYNQGAEFVVTLPMTQLLSDATSRSALPQHGSIAQ